MQSQDYYLANPHQTQDIFFSFADKSEQPIQPFRSLLREASAKHSLTKATRCHYHRQLSLGHSRGVSHSQLNLSSHSS